MSDSFKIWVICLILVVGWYCCYLPGIILAAFFVLGLLEKEYWAKWASLLLLIALFITAMCIAVNLGIHYGYKEGFLKSGGWRIPKFFANTYFWVSILALIAAGFVSSLPKKYFAASKKISAGK